MDQGNSYIRSDEHGVKRVADTRISIDSVIIGFQQGQSPEEIQRNFPALTLEQVYGTIAYYLGHRDEIDQYLAVQRATWDRLRSEAEKNPSAAVEQLRQARISKLSSLMSPYKTTHRHGEWNLGEPVGKEVW